MITNGEAANALSGTPGAPFLGTPGTTRVGLSDYSVWHLVVGFRSMLPGSRYRILTNGTP